MRRPSNPRAPIKPAPNRTMLLAGAATLVVLGALTAIGFGFYQFNKSLRDYCGIKREYNRNEVLYRLGFPALVMDDSQKNSKYPGRRGYETNRKGSSTDDPDKMIPSGKTVSDYFEWSYPLRLPNNAAASVYVDFDPATKSIDNIDCVDFSEGAHVCPSLAGVLVGDNEDRVRNKLGAPDRSELDGVTKTMIYESIGVEFKLTKGAVYYLRLYGAGPLSEFRLFYVYVRGLITSVIN